MSTGALRQRVYVQRRKAGLERVEPAWQGLSTAKVQEAARTAFRRVSWLHRAAGPGQADQFREDLVNAFEDLLEVELGLVESVGWLDGAAGDMPSSWTAQYAQFAPSQVTGEEVQHACA